MGGLLTVCMVMLTSCLDDGNNEQQGSVYAVAGASKDFSRIVLTYSDGQLPFYLKNVPETSLTNGDCYLIGYSYKDEDNPDPTTLGYLNVTITQQIVTVPKGVTRYSPDTASTAYENEIPIASIYQGSGSMSYVSGYFFFTSVINDMKEKQEQDIQVSFAYDPEPVTESNVRYYNLYLRAIKTTEGSGTSGTGYDTKAYQIRTFINNAGAREKELNSSATSINVRLNYIKEFDSTTGAPVWDKLDMTNAFAVAQSES